jgi:hypothetical protein
MIIYTQDQQGNTLDKLHSNRLIYKYQYLCDWKFVQWENGLHCLELFVTFTFLGKWLITASCLCIILRCSLFGIGDV